MEEGYARKWERCPLKTERYDPASTAWAEKAAIDKERQPVSKTDTGCLVIQDLSESGGAPRLLMGDDHAHGVDPADGFICSIKKQDRENQLEQSDVVFQQRSDGANHPQPELSDSFQFLEKND